MNVIGNRPRSESLTESLVTPLKNVHAHWPAGNEIVHRRVEIIYMVANIVFVSIAGATCAGAAESAGPEPRAARSVRLGYESAAAFFTSI